MVILVVEPLSLRVRVPILVEENTQKAEYMYFVVCSLERGQHMDCIFGSVLLNHFYLSAVNFFQVWVDDVLVG